MPVYLELIGKQTQLAYIISVFDDIHPLFRYSFNDFWLKE